ncbi:hypothetical protein JHK85_004614 [Glycine max]|nr:hypothetical protein JHK85_004614 [Glycine max]
MGPTSCIVCFTMSKSHTSATISTSMIPMTSQIAFYTSSDFSNDRTRVELLPTQVRQYIG